MKKIFLVLILAFSTLSFVHAQNNGMTPLMEASANNDLATVNKLLTAGAFVDAQDDRGLTALMFASLNGFPDIIQALIDSDASINMTDKMAGSTALFWAATADRLEAAKTLIRNNADRTIQDIHHKTALDYARSDEMRKLLSPGPRI